MRKYRVHMPGLVHLPISERYMGCAFTQKIVKMSKMLLSLGHEVYLYGAEGSDAPCTEFIQTHSLDELRDTWGEGDNRFELGYDWRRKGFKHDFNKVREDVTKRFYARTIEAINDRKKANDFLFLMQGSYHRPIDKGVSLYLTCEPGIGYRGSYSNFRAFESAYLQNFTYGSEHPRESINGNYYDRVIPNYFDPDNFDYTDEKEDYFVFIGRLISRKGVQTAFRVAQELGVKLKIAGQGMKSWDEEKKRLVATDFTIQGDVIDYIGYVDVEERKPLLAKAKAVFVPTLYLEAFGGTNVEAQMSGTPAITTNFGVFPETVVHGVTGYRCNTLAQFVEAGRRTLESQLDYSTIRKWAIENYAMDRVKFQFAEWMDSLYDLYESTGDNKKKGWSRIKSVTGIDQYIKYYPNGK